MNSILINCDQKKKKSKNKYPVCGPHKFVIHYSKCYVYVTVQYYAFMSNVHILLILLDDRWRACETTNRDSW